jgi:hypothetical protein
MPILAPSTTSSPGDEPCVFQALADQERRRLAA